MPTIKDIENRFSITTSKPKSTASKSTKNSSKSKTTNSKKKPNKAKSTKSASNKNKKSSKPSNRKSGKNTNRVTVKTYVILPTNKTSSSVKSKSGKVYKLPDKKSKLMNDSKRKALPAGKRVSKNGKTYYEYRSNHADYLDKPRSFKKVYGFL